MGANLLLALRERRGATEDKCLLHRVRAAMVVPTVGCVVVVERNENPVTTGKIDKKVPLDW